MGDIIAEETAWLTQPDYISNSFSRTASVVSSARLNPLGTYISSDMAVYYSQIKDDNTELEGDWGTEISVDASRRLTENTSLFLDGNYYSVTNKIPGKDHEDLGFNKLIVGTQYHIDHWSLGVNGGREILTSPLFEVIRERDHGFSQRDLTTGFSVASENFEPPRAETETYGLHANYADEFGPYFNAQVNAEELEFGDKTINGTAYGLETGYKFEGEAGTDLFAGSRINDNDYFQMSEVYAGASFSPFSDNLRTMVSAAHRDFELDQPMIDLSSSQFYADSHEADMALGSISYTFRGGEGPTLYSTTSYMQQRFDTMPHLDDNIKTYSIGASDTFADSVRVDLEVQKSESDNFQKSDSTTYMINAYTKF